MADFLSTPFMLIAQVSLWICSFITGDQYILMAIGVDDDIEGDQDGY